MAFSDEEIKEFKIEAEELLDNSEKSLLAIDKGESFATHYNSIFRAFHSIKGAAGMMEMPALQNHMHQLENTLVVQKSQGKLEKPYIDLFLRGNDAARSLLNNEAVQFDYSVAAVVKDDEPNLVEPSKKNPPRKAPLTGKVLVINDDPAILDGLMAVLREVSFEAISETRPEEALKHLDAFQPDVVLVNRQTSHFNGVEFLALVAKAHPEIPVVFMDNENNLDSILDSIELGVSGFIEKPLRDAKIVEACASAVQKRLLTKILNKSINLILYQFFDLDEFLKSQGKEEVRKTISDEVHSILELQKKIKSKRSER
jgi:DNA-binding NarL/FixJ family response regulator/HPt (histidine-containing phosphotransfer) domain-containing protein